MVRRERPCWVSVICITIMMFLGPHHCFSEIYDRYFESGIGYGETIAGKNGKHYMLAPAVTWELKEHMKVRIEGDFEKIEHEGKETWVLGIGPFIRLLIPTDPVRPFIELGAGVNYISRREVEGSKLGCQFIISMMGGAGFEFSLNDVPLSLAYRYRHLSNAGACETNQGIDTNLIMLSIGLKNF